MPRLSPASWLLALVWPVLAAADLPPSCSRVHDGVQVCMAHQVCTCAFDPAGTLTGRTPGWRWSCDILQTCEEDSPAGPDVPDAPMPGPLYLTPNLMPPVPPR